VTEFSAYAIGYSYHKFIKPACVLDVLIVSGGGARNKELMRLIRNYLTGIQIKKLNNFGITPDSKEAVLFAVLGNECIASNSANIRSATGAKKDAVLGKICLASGNV
jgi:anhydro-N-acetylmuramic acid kinase